MEAWLTIENVQSIIFWLVVSAPPKNISQMGVLFPMYGTT
jgi:hypothetical protein